jgi:hypothetical protein
MASEASITDTDRDGEADSVDNCPYYWNPEQWDADGDSIGNVCDECTDQDGDGFGDPGFPTNTCPEDNCPGFSNPDQLDSDGDGVGDICGGLECADVGGNGWAGLDDLSLFVDFLWYGGRAPVSMAVANSGGCNGVNVHDIVFTWSEAAHGWLNCFDSSDCPPYSVGGISLDHVEGVCGTDSMVTGQLVRMYLRMHGDDSVRFDGIANGFRVWSPTGAEWDRTTVTELIDFAQWPPVFDVVQSVSLVGADGASSDTIAFGYMGMLPPHTGISPGFDSVTHVIEIGPIPDEYSGGEICLDSCWYPPGGDWMWAAHGPYSAPYTPSWDGPHCFVIYNCCDLRGDINRNGSGPDITDLVYLVSYMFQAGPQPPCLNSADINGDDGDVPDISDLVYLVTYMFQSGPAPAPCPQQ